MQTTCLVVLGMHRSGTSALMRCLNLLGVDLGRELLRANADNPTGFWENTRAVEINERILQAVGRACHDSRLMPDGWERAADVSALRSDIERFLDAEFSATPLFGLKDPRLCRLLPAWLASLAQASTRLCFVIALREPSEVARSLRRRNGICLEEGYLQWLLHVLEAERVTRGHQRTVVTYAGLLADWRSALATIGDWLGRDLAAPDLSATIDSFLTPSLRHFDHLRDRDDSPCGHLATAAYQVMVQPNALDRTERLDELWAEARRLAAVAGPVVDQVVALRVEVSALGHALELQRGELIRSQAELARVLHHPVFRPLLRLWKRFVNPSFPTA